MAGKCWDTPGSSKVHLRKEAIMFYEPLMKQLQDNVINDSKHIIFNTFMDDLLQGIHQKFATAGDMFPAVIYADDLLLLEQTESEALSM